MATAAPGLGSAVASAGALRPGTRRTARSLCGSKTTACAGRLSPESVRTVVSDSPATTCAAVTTRSGLATQPLPSTPRPHAVPRMRTTLRSALRGPGSLSTRGFGGRPAAQGRGAPRARPRRRARPARARSRRARAQTRRPPRARPRRGRSSRGRSCPRLARMDGPELQEFIDRYNAAWNAHDVDAILTMHTDDSVFENHTTGDVNVGKDAIGNAIRGIFSVFPDLSFEGRRTYIRDDLVVQEWTARGTNERLVDAVHSPFCSHSVSSRPTRKGVLFGARSYSEGTGSVTFKRP